MKTLVRSFMVLFVVVSILLIPAPKSVVASSDEPTLLPWGNESPKFCVSSITGERHAVWGSNDSIIRHSQRFQGVWSTPEQVARGTNPAIACSPNGTTDVVFENQFKGNWEIYFSFWTEPGWALPINVSHTTGESRNPKISVGPGNAIHIVWQDDYPGYEAVLHAQSCGDMFCSDPVPSARGQNPDVLAVDGYLLVPFLGDNGQVLLVVFQQGIWGLPLFVSDEKSEPAGRMSIDASPAANSIARIAWYTESGKWVDDVYVGSHGWPAVTDPVRIKEVFLPLVKS